MGDNNKLSKVKTEFECQKRFKRRLDGLFFFVLMLPKQLRANADSCFSSTFFSAPVFSAVSGESVSHSPTGAWQGSRGSRGPLLTRVQPALVGFSVSHAPLCPPKCALGLEGCRSRATQKLGHPVDDINNSSPSSSPPHPCLFPSEKNDPDLRSLTGWCMCVGVCVSLDSVKRMRSYRQPPLWIWTKINFMNHSHCFTGSRCSARCEVT